MDDAFRDLDDEARQECDDEWEDFQDEVDEYDDGWQFDHCSRCGDGNCEGDCFNKEPRL